MGFAPDIVSLGKPMANGHPVAAVVTRPVIMAAYSEAFGYYSTFGGNPVSMAAALAVLEVIEAEGLIDNARKTGAHTLGLLQALSHPRIAEVRGRGLFFAVEFAGDDPGGFTGRVVEAMKDRGVLLGRVGRHGQVLKLRPPMPFARADAEEAVGKLAEVLAGLPE
jgi:4-aminobutyrate aminotransferase-like enzyme